MSFSMRHLGASRLVDSSRPSPARSSVQLGSCRPSAAASRQLRPDDLRQLQRSPAPLSNARRTASLQVRAGTASFSESGGGKSGSTSFQRGPSSDDTSAAGAKAKSTKVAIYIFLWYGANIWFNRQNKMLLNVFPCPWFIATMQLVGSFVCGLFIWGTGIQPKPETSPEFLKSLAPVALFHTLGHVTACIAFGAMAVSFAHIVKSAEPVFSVLLSAPLLGTAYPPFRVWASLVPIIAGCAISSLNEVTFAWAGFLNASASNVGMVLRNIVSKK